MEQTIVEFPEDKKLLRLADAANWTAKLALVVIATYAGLKFYNDIFYSFRGLDLVGFLRGAGLLNALIMVFGLFDHFIYAVFVYVVLRGIEEVLYLLMDIRGVLVEDEPVTDAPEEGADDVSQ